MTDPAPNSPALQRLAVLLEHAEPETKEAFRTWAESRKEYAEQMSAIVAAYDKLMEKTVQELEGSK